MQALSQRDARWKDIKLGFSQDTTIGSHGCTITAIAMFAGITPDEVNERMKRVGGYLSGNLVIWNKLKEAMPWIEFEYKHYSYDNALALDKLKTYGAILIELDFDGTPRTDGRHWVLFIGDKKMNDPWTGTTDPTTKYGILYSIVVLKRLDGKAAGDKPSGTIVGGCLLENSEEGRATFERLVANSTKADAAVKSLSLGENANEVSADTIKKSIAAKDGAYSACSTKLSEAEQEVKNRVEQIGRLKEQATEAEKTYNAEYIKLNKQLQIEQQRVAEWQSKAEQAQSNFIAEAKAKGEALNEVARMQAKVDLLQKSILSNLSFLARLKLLFS